MATIVDDSNSNLFWSGSSWKTEHSDDPLTGKYFNSGEYCIIAWEGTDIYVYGARRKKFTCLHPYVLSHGLYGVVIDGGDIQYFSGFSQDGQFQATLFATNGLQDGSHTLKISNENERNQDQYPDYVWLDIDSVAVSGTLINADTSASSSSTASSTIISSSSSGNSLKSTDISSGQYSATLSSATIISTASEVLTSSSQSRLPPTDGPVASPVADPLATAENSEQSNDRKTITLAISIPVIVISSIVIFVFVGLYFYRRRKRRYERQYDHGYNGYMEEPQSSWR
ncbi:uncharacterized protein L199_002801 [Kwoniella botswanensis]|uniref:uncharacterized protein n=1 Tax=Kwoniella botswanensis TaxID=1268659 RepID=UPI00315D1E74